VLSAFYLGDERAMRSAGDRRGYFTAVRSALQAWAQREDAPAGLESWRAFGDRVNAAADEVCASLDQSDVVLVVTSGGVIGRLVAASLGADAEAAIQLNLQTRNTGITELIRGRSVSRLVAFNAIPHLEHPARAHAVTHS
jgi:broad specificity phosphatase PhoE